MARTRKPAPDGTAALRRALLSWYRRHCRDLPWRAKPGQTPNPYHVLVSEAMLQQTQVATVIDYFNRFVAELPTIQSLAEADEQQVLKLWQGLGYYRRARHLHAAARAIVDQYGGRIPDTVDALLKLPGVGRYTAGAIASIAFGRPAPIVDGNVARVLARWFAITDPVDAPSTRERVWSLAESLVPRTAPGDFNQALMELGATVCTPRSPRCLICPVQKHCAAHERGLVDELPRTLPRRAPKPVTHHVVAVRRGDVYLFEQRPHKGLWSNMWQMPTCESLDGDSLRQWTARRLGTAVSMPKKLGEFTHQTTHRTIQFVVWTARTTRSAASRNGDRTGPTAAWRALDQLDDLPLPNPQRRAIAMVQMATSS